MPKKSKRKNRYLDFLQKELAFLDTVKVNVFSNETLKAAAPDTHQVIKTYLERRIKEVDVLKALPKKS